MFTNHEAKDISDAYVPRVSAPMREAVSDTVMDYVQIELLARVGYSHISSLIIRTISNNLKQETS